MQQLRIKRSDGQRGRLLTAMRTFLPGAWVTPSNDELVTLYRLRYRMAMEEKKFDSALIFLNKILEVDPLNLEAKLDKGDLYHRHLGDYTRAVEQYNKVIRMSSSREDRLQLRARASLEELMEMLS